jgi:hypothetical protein
VGRRAERCRDEEAKRWAAARNDVAILTPDEGYRLGRQLMSRFLDQAS